MKERGFWGLPLLIIGGVVLFSFYQSRSIASGSIQLNSTIISWVQNFLNNWLGYQQLAITGNWDSDTQNILKQFQNQSGLPMTGQLDQQTYSRMNYPLG